MDGTQGSSEDRDRDLAARASPSPDHQPVESAKTASRKQLLALLLAGASTPEERRIALGAFDEDDDSPRSEADMREAVGELLAHRGRRNGVFGKSTVPVNQSGSATSVGAPLRRMGSSESSLPANRIPWSSAFYEHLQREAAYLFSLVAMRQTLTAPVAPTLARRSNSIPAGVRQHARNRAQRVADIRAGIALPPTVLPWADFEPRRAAHVQALRVPGPPIAPDSASNRVSVQESSVQNNLRETDDWLDPWSDEFLTHTNRQLSQVRADATATRINFRPVVWNREQSAPTAPVSGDAPAPIASRQPSARRAGVAEATVSQNVSHMADLNSANSFSGGIIVTPRTVASPTGGLSTPSIRSPPVYINRHVVAVTAGSIVRTNHSPASWVYYHDTRGIGERNTTTYTASPDASSSSRTYSSQVSSFNDAATRINTETASGVSVQGSRISARSMGNPATTPAGRPPRLSRNATLHPRHPDSPVAGSSYAVTRDRGGYTSGTQPRRLPGHLAAARPAEREAIVDPSQPANRRSAVGRVAQSTAALWRMTEGLHFNPWRGNPRPPSSPPTDSAPATNPSSSGSRGPAVPNTSTHANSRAPSPTPSNPQPPVLPRSAHRILIIPIPPPSTTPREPDPWDAMILESDGSYTPAPTRPSPDPDGFRSDNPIVLSIHPSWPQRHRGLLTRARVEEFLAVLDPNAGSRTTPATQETRDHLHQNERTWNPQPDRDAKIERSRERQSRLAQRARDTQSLRGGWWWALALQRDESDTLEAEEEAEPPFCVICSERFRAGRTVYSELECGHNFCGRCIQNWLRTNGTCPTCRRRVKA